MATKEERALGQDRPLVEKLLINEYWWARHLVGLGPNVLDLPEYYLTRLVKDAEMELRAFGIDVDEVRKELRIAGVSYMDKSTAAYQEIRVEPDLDEKLRSLFADDEFDGNGSSEQISRGGDGAVAAGEIYFLDFNCKGLSEEGVELLELWEEIFEDMLNDPEEEVMRHELRIEAMESIEKKLVEEHEFHLDATPRHRLAENLGLYN